MCLRLRLLFVYYCNCFSLFARQNIERRLTHSPASSYHFIYLVIPFSISVRVFLIFDHTSLSIRFSERKKACIAIEGGFGDIIPHTGKRAHFSPCLVTLSV